MNCTTEDLQRNGIVFIKDSSKEEPYVKILSINDTDIITTSEGMFDLVSGELDGRSRDELYECNYVFGQTLH